MSVPKLAPSTSSLRPPGPGAYHHETHHRSRGNLEWLEAPHTGHCSAFKAIARKTEFDGRHTAPPPGTYDLSKGWGAAEANKTHFKNHSARDFSYASPPAATGPASLIFPHEPPLCYGRAPGPGTYNLQDAQSMRRKVEARFECQSAAFRRATTPKRPPRGPGAAAAVQRPRVLLTGAGAAEAEAAPTAGGCSGGPAAAAADARCGPGPGTYAVHAVKTAIDPTRGAAAPFVSKVSKSALLDPVSFRNLPPGPAYYDPHKPAAHSNFHLNARKRFV